MVSILAIIPKGCGDLQGYVHLLRRDRGFTVTRNESLIVFTGGTVMNCVTWKESPDKWNWALTGSLEDGKKIKGRGYWLSKDKHKQLHLISDDFTIGGKPADKLHDKYIRVK